MNRVIRERDVDAIYVCGPGHGGPGIVANVYLEGTYSEVYHAHRPRRDRPAPAVPAVLVPGRHPQPRRPRDAGLDPRGRRAGLRAHARLRRGLRQPRPRRVLRDRRRRGRDRPAGHELALQQVPRRPRATARCCRSCTSTATRSPTRPCSRGSPRTSCARCSSGTATSRASSPATTRPRCTSCMAATLDDVVDEIRSHAARGARGRRREAPALADDRAAHAQGLDGPARGRRPAGGGDLPRPPGAALAGSPPTRSTSMRSRPGCAPTGPRSCSTDDGALVA